LLKTLICAGDDEVLMCDFLTFKITKFFISFNKGSERSSKDLEVSNNLDDNLDQEWSQISRMHDRYFYNLLTDLFFIGIHYLEILHFYTYISCFMI